MSQLLSNVTPAVLALLTSGIIFLIWYVTRRRIATQTVGRAEQEAERILRDARRDAETQKKELVLAAKEEAHELIRTAEEQTRQRHEEVTSLEKTLAAQTRSMSDRTTEVDKIEQDLAARTDTLEQKETDVSAQATRYEQLVADLSEAEGELKEAEDAVAESADLDGDRGRQRDLREQLDIVRGQLIERRSQDFRGDGPVECRERLGGMLRYYRRAA